MDGLKVLFIGVGSIAIRHINNLRHICKNRRINLTVDAFRRSISSNVNGVDRVYHSVSDVPEDYDVVFITNPTWLHYESLIQFQDKGKNFFIEKPLVSLDYIDKAKELNLKENSIYYVACPLRYNAVIDFLKTNIDPKNVLSARSISSSYLPNWRHGQDYRKTYSSSRKLGGGVSIDLIHEWDYLTWLFGFPEKLSCYIGKKSSLEIDSDDYAIYIADYDNMIIELHLDYFGRKTIREIMIETEEDTILGDIENNRVEFYRSGRIIDFKEERNDFHRRELNCFLDRIEEIDTSKDDYYHALSVLELTQGILWRKSSE